MKNLDKSTKRMLIYGFLFGAIVLPFLSVLGLIIPYFEYLKPLLILGNLAAQPFIVQLSANAYEMAPVGWIAYLFVNGLVYAGVFALAHTFFKKEKVQENIA